MSSSVFRCGLTGYAMPIDDLRRRVQLAIEILHRGHQLRGREERALLAVEELRQGPREHLDVGRLALLLGHPVVQIRAEQRHQLLGAVRLLEVDVGLPWQHVVGDPLRPHGLVVEVAQLLPRLLVAPRVRDIEQRLERLERRASGPRTCVRFGGCLHRRPSLALKN
jgi:hypothetical protein